MEAELDDHARALGLSRVLRAYLEARFTWPAGAATTREIGVASERHHWMAATHRERAGRILTSTDRLKFARQGGGATFFAELDADFEAVVSATIPLPPLPGQEARAGEGDADA
jgi:hypothetical protein